MRICSLDPRRARPAELEGRLLAHDVPPLRKGDFLTAAHLEQLRELPAIHVVELEPGDLHEDQAAERLARAVSGVGVRRGRIVQS